MAVYDLEEQEQISQLKAWWEQYGRLVTAIAVVAALTSVGWQAYNWYRNNQAAEAGALFYAVQVAVESGDAARTRESAGQLIERFPGSAYADLGAMLSASMQFAQGEAKNARTQLDWLVANGRDPVMRDLARLRLAAVLLEEGSRAEALAALEKPPVAGLSSRFDDLRGDILSLDGKPVEARKAYQSALEALAREGVAAGDALYEVIRVKSESLEG